MTFTIRTLAICAVLALAVAANASAQHTHPAPGPASGGGLQIPEPMRIEHEAIHSQLEAATRAPGAVGVAARELAKVLGPHFARENQIALPPLALLEPLSRGESIPRERVAQAIAMTDSLKAELPRMLEEHVHIDAAAKKLEQVARQNGNADAAELAHNLQLHARTEQAVTYPAALLVGTVLRHEKQ